jgi:hypothetical protein
MTLVEIRAAEGWRRRQTPRTPTVQHLLQICPPEGSLAWRWSKSGQGFLSSLSMVRRRQTFSPTQVEVTDGSAFPPLNGTVACKPRR